LLAPLAPALGFSLLFSLSGWAWGELSVTEALLGTLELAGYVAGFAYVATFLVACPAYLLLRRLAVPRMWHALVIGTAAGGLLPPILLSPHWVTSMFGALMGLGTAGVFWALLAFPQQPPDTAPPNQRMELSGGAK
jgi:hypothetical protein